MGSFVIVTTADPQDLIDWLTLLCTAPFATDSWLHPHIWQVLSHLDPAVRRRVMGQIQQRSRLEQEQLEILFSEFETLDEAGQDRFLNCIKRGVV